MRRTLAALPLLLDPAHDARVETEARAEGEPARRDRLVLRARGSGRQAQAHRPLALLAQRVEQGAGRLDRIVGQPQRAGEHIGGAAGDHRQPGQPVRIGPVVQEPVDHLVDRAVAAEGDDEVEPLVRGLASQVPGVPAVLGGHRLQLHLAGQGMGQDVARARTGGRRCWVGHEKCTHERQTTHPSPRRPYCPSPQGSGVRRYPAGVSKKQPAQAPIPAAAPPAELPGRLTAAAALTALEGLALAGLGVYMLFVGIAGDPDSPQQAETGGITLLALAALPLSLGRRWSRGPALITQLMAMPVAWTLYSTGGAMIAAAAALALAAVAVVVLLVNPTATEALGIGPGEQAR